VLIYLGGDPSDLSQDEAARRLEMYGPKDG
jgi:hypothetical protein